MAVGAKVCVGSERGVVSCSKYAEGSKKLQVINKNENIIYIWIEKCEQNNLYLN